MTTRRAVVTGASSGIGLAIVERLVADGWRVTGMARRPVPIPGARSILADLAAPGGGLPELNDLEPVDAFIHAAGVLRTAELGALRPEDLARAITFVAQTPRGGFIANLELQPEAPLAEAKERQSLALGEEGMPNQ